MPYFRRAAGILLRFLGGIYMLEQRDLEMIRSVMEESTQRIVHEAIQQEVPVIVTDIIKRDVPDIVTDIVKRDVPDIVTDIVTDIVDDSIHDSENLLLQEMERMEQRLGDRISSVEQSVQELKEYYYIARLDHDALDMVSRTVADHSERIAALEQKTA